MKFVKTILCVCWVLMTAVSFSCGSGKPAGEEGCVSDSCENEQETDALECITDDCDEDLSKEGECIGGDCDLDAVEQGECVPVSGPDYWGCLPPGFEEPRYTDSCSLEEGFVFCISQTPCSCDALKCEGGAWMQSGAADISCRVVACDLSAFDPDSGGDWDCDF